MWLKSVGIFLILSIHFVSAVQFGRPFRVINPNRQIKWCRKTTDICFCDPKGMERSGGLPGLPGVNGLKGDIGSQGTAGLPGIPGKDGTKGQKGDKGERGFSGDRGKDGPKGEQGERGQPGSTGHPGPEGPKGKQGDVGMPGPPGQLGQKGEKGAIGTSGVKGDAGKTGPKGDKGLNGPPGPRGLEGICSCPTINTGKDDYEVEVDSGAPLMPSGKVPRACKELNGDDSMNDLFDLSKDGTRNTLFKAYCMGRKTCLKPKVRNSTVLYNTKTPFMLSSYEFDPRYEIEKETLLSLQSLSTNAMQHIKIQCLNSYVYSDGNDYESHSISFVTWNDIMLRSHPTQDNPYFFYTVDKDGCKDSAQEWKVTEFVLQSDKAERLPITDIHVRDVRGEDQQIRIELGDLCFE